jgi:pyruvate dehydrogenase E1 component alpha subunit
VKPDATAAPESARPDLEAAPERALPDAQAAPESAQPNAKPSPAPPLSPAKARRLADFYRQMLLIRRFEERAGRSYTQALIGGYLHLNLGEEAFIVGAAAAMKPTDYLFTNYREHGFAIARGADPGRVMAELYGRADGLSKGWGGSMHMFDLEHRLMGGYGIVGGQLPLATGAALAIDYRGGGEAVVATMGDGTTNIGAFHESLNIAALWNLPIVYLVDNNELGMGTTVERSSAQPDLHKRAAAYKMASARVNGLDPDAVYLATRHALTRARAGRPFLLEVMTVRLKGHSVVDPASYRSAEEAALALSRDPLARAAAQLVESGAATPAQLDVWDQQAHDAVAQAERFAKASPLPPVDALFDHTYATPVPNESRRLPGDPLFPIPPEALCLLPNDYYEGGRTASAAGDAPAAGASLATAGAGRGAAA